MKKNLPTSFLAVITISAVIYTVESTITAETENNGHLNHEISGRLKSLVATRDSGLKTSLPPREKSKNAESQVWRSIRLQQIPKAFPDHLAVEYVQVDDQSTLKVSEGHKVSFLIPQENKAYSGTVQESTRAFGGKVNIASGDINNGNKNASFSITEGDATTFITVATGESIYQVEIDKKTGIGVVLDDRELDQYRHNEDGILPPPEGVS